MKVGKQEKEEERNKERKKESCFYPLKRAISIVRCCIVIGIQQAVFLTEGCMSLNTK
jgi:hypothetical protein